MSVCLLIVFSTISPHEVNVDVSGDILSLQELEGCFNQAVVTLVAVLYYSSAGLRASTPWTQSNCGEQSSISPESSQQYLLSIAVLHPAKKKQMCWTPSLNASIQHPSPKLLHQLFSQNFSAHVRRSYSSSHYSILKRLVALMGYWVGGLVWLGLPLL